MTGLEDEIRAIEEEISSTPYNKATSKHIGRLKAKLAKVKDDAVQRAMKAGGGGEGFSVKKSGDATAVLVGFPSTGKSTLLNALTGTESEVASYAFTTVTVIPGALEHRGAKIQILDIPGMIAGAAMGKGRGKEVISVVRSADMIVLLVDVWNEKHFDILIRELADAGIRINREKPDITIRKTSIGGVHVGSVGEIGMDDEEIKAIMAEYRLVNAHVLIRGGATQDDLIDTMLGNRVYVPALLAVNKVDLVDGATMQSIEEDLTTRFGERPLMISAASGYHMEEAEGRDLRSPRFHPGIHEAPGGGGGPRGAHDPPEERNHRGRLPEAAPGVRGEVPVRKDMGRCGEAPRAAGGAPLQGTRRGYRLHRHPPVIARARTPTGASVLIAVPE